MHRGRFFLSWNELGGEWPLYFDGGGLQNRQGQAHDFIFTIENIEGEISEQAITFEMQEPLPPSFVSEPGDIQTVAGYNKTYKYPEIEQTYPPFTVSVDINANQYIKDLLNLRLSDDSKWFLGFHGKDEAWYEYEGQELQLTA